MRYSTVLFDLDMTLLNFNADERAALTCVLKQNGIDCREENLRAYHEINLSLWKSFERGEIKRTDITRTRFALLLRRLGIDADSELLNSQYIEKLCLGGRLIEGADEICRELSENGASLYIITNGTQNIQQERLKRSGLQAYIDGVFVSEKIGFQKPMREYFDYVLSEIPQKNKRRILVVGDSLSSDISGGNGAGLDTCLFSPDLSEHNDSIKPLYTIQALSQLKSIVCQGV